MADMCTTPDGGSMWTLGLGYKWFSIIFVSILGFFPLAVVLLGPKLVFYFGSIVGYYLRKKTAGRKAQILDLVEAEEKEYQAGSKGRRDSDEWENVQSGLADENGGAAADREWDGIVGFFHPFWWVSFTIETSDVND
jgi:alpha-1,2-mannosyltransferase